MRGGAAGSLEATSCRICSTPDSLLTSTSKGTRACLKCMRAEQVWFADGSVKRFCYGHRVFEPIDQACVVPYALILVPHPWLYTIPTTTRQVFFCAKAALCTLVFRLRRLLSHFSAPPPSRRATGARACLLSSLRLDLSEIHE